MAINKRFEKITFGIQITKPEIIWVFGVATALWIITSIPTFFGFLSTPPDKWFFGVVENVHDTAQYLSWMREASNQWLITNKLTSESNPAIFFNLHWWLPGRIAALTNLSLSQIYQVLRVVSVYGLVGISYILCAIIFADRQRRQYALFLSLLTSGLGWIWVIIKPFVGELLFPRDLHTTLGNAFYTMIASPHLTLSSMWTITVFVLAIQAIRNKRVRWTLLTGCVALFLGMGHVYDLVTIWAVLAGWGLLLTLRDGWNWGIFTRLITVVLCSAPAVLYWGWVSSDANPSWKQALAQFNNLGVFTPSVPHLLILLGITFIIALLTYTGFIPLRSQTNELLLIKAWFITTPLLVYLPLPFQITLLTGYQAPIAILAMIGLTEHIFPAIPPRFSHTMFGWPTAKMVEKALPIVFLLAVLPANIYLLCWRVYDLNRHSYPYYLFIDDVAGFNWLEHNTNPNDVVLSSFTIGHYLPGLSGNRAFLSNAVMTMDFNHKYESVQKFFDQEILDIYRKDLIQQYGIHYIFYGEAEKSLGQYNPEDSPFFHQVFKNGKVTIYSTQPIENEE